MLIDLKENVFQTKNVLNSDGSLIYKWPSLPGSLVVSSETVDYVVDKVEARIKQALADPQLQKDYNITEEQLLKLQTSKDLKFMAGIGINADLEDLILVLSNDEFYDADADFNSISSLVNSDFFK